MNQKQIIWCYLGLTACTVGPLLCALLASSIASLSGSRLDEGGVHPCIVLGVDMGAPLYRLFVMGWLAILTIPTGIAGIIILSCNAKGKESRRFEDWAMASISLAVISLVTGPLGGIPSIVCGIVARKHIAKKPALAGKGLALAGIIIGFLGTLLHIDFLLGAL